MILSCPDKLGDAIVALPAAGWIRRHAPGTRIIAICRGYTEPIWRACAHIDDVVTTEALQAAGDDGAAARLAALGAEALVHLVPVRQVAKWAHAAQIPIRIGTLRRPWLWRYCNVRPNVVRNRSRLHQAQQHIQLLAHFGLQPPTRVQELADHMGLAAPAPSPRIAALLRADRPNVVVHPLADAGPDWGLDRFAELIRLLPPERYNVLVTGVAAEAARYRAALPLDGPHVTDLGGALTLDELMQLLGASDAVVASSTGPLHIAAALGVRTIGVFTMQRSKSPLRWGPIGRDTRVLIHDLRCPSCARDAKCRCLENVEARRVAAHLEDINIAESGK